MSAVAIWSLELEPGKPHTFAPPADLRITNVALDENIQDASGRSVIKFSHPDPSSAEVDEDDDDDAQPPLLMAKTVLCSLIPGKAEQTSVDITLLEEDEYTLEVTGKNTVHLLGNYLSIRTGLDSMSDSEDDFDLQDVSSDVEMELDPAELDDEEDSHRFEEVKEDEPKAGSKRPHEGEESPKMSKAEKKKAKKMKGADGEAAPAPSEDAKPSKDKSKKEGKDAKEKDGANEKDKDKKKKKDQNQKTVTLPSGLKYVESKSGNGAKAKKGDSVQMRYIGKLTNGKVFDSNTKGKPFTFNLGAGEVIKGWDEGIVGMAAGGERLLIVPPNLGYGKRGTDGIPPNSELHFEVKLVQIK